MLINGSVLANVPPASLGTPGSRCHPPSGSAFKEPRGLRAVLEMVAPRCHLGARGCSLSPQHAQVNLGRSWDSSGGVCTAALGACCCLFCAESGSRVPGVGEQLGPEGDVLAVPGTWALLLPHSRSGNPAPSLLRW